MLTYFFMPIKKRWKELFIIIFSAIILYLLHINDYIIKNVIENNFILILFMNIFGIIYFYQKYFNKNKKN